jgi:hypothetical protein
MTVSPMARFDLDLTYIRGPRSGFQVCGHAMRLEFSAPLSRNRLEFSIQAP